MNEHVYKRHILRLLAFETHIVVRWVTQSSAVLFAMMVQHFLGIFKAQPAARLSCD